MPSAPSDPPADSGVRRFAVVGIAGSLRHGSFNRALLAAAVDLAPAGLHIAMHDLAPLPLYNADVDASGAPRGVADLRDAVRTANALLIATPEYNYGVPGVLKNAIDWLSRPHRKSALEGKPAAIMGASSGMSGTARCQSQIRQAFVSTNTYAMLQPEVLVRHAQEKFNAEGRLTDKATRDLLSHFLQGFEQWIDRFNT
jgi:chromate reductase